MNRITNLNNIDFPVKLLPVFIKDKKYKEAKGYRAVTGKTEGKEKIFSVVSNNYSLITNTQAFELGRRIFREFFPAVNEKDFTIFNVTHPETRSFCYIDIVNNLYTFNIWESEVYVPFMRITNSYNKTKALRFDIGFSREMCDNGVIFEKETVSINYIHYKRDFKKNYKEILNDFKPGEKFGKLKSLEKEFTGFMQKLRDIKIDKKYYVPMTAKIFNLKFNIDSENENLKKRDIKLMKEFIDYCKILRNKYSYILGNNAYSVFNVATEFANNRDFVKGYRYNEFQSKAGEWLKAVANRKDKDTLEEYLKEYKYLMNNN